MVSTYTFDNVHLEVHSTLPCMVLTEIFDSPGRFFALNELKCLMGHILLNYDIKWSNRDFLEGGYAPPNKNLGIFSHPDQNATVMFRRRTRG